MENDQESKADEMSVCLPNVGMESDHRLGVGDKSQTETEGRRQVPLWGFRSVCGKRTEMEDAVAVVPHFMEIPVNMFLDHVIDDDVSPSLTTHFFGVYDGHNGSEVANYCHKRLHLALQDQLKHFEQESLESTTMQVKWDKVFTRCFQGVDAEVSGIVAPPNTLYITPPTPIAPHTVGSTAVVAIVCSSHIIVANCGDSRAVLYRQKEAVILSNDHKPNREAERARIEAAGGTILNWNGHRVCGVLATSRSIGDGYLKPFVVPDPEVICTSRARSDDCLILASDGLWDVLSNEEVCQTARRRIFMWHKKNGVNTREEQPTDGIDPAAQSAADYLTALAIRKGSSDNISIIVVDLKSHRHFKSKS